jgi:hypothetical protein
MKSLASCAEEFAADLALARGLSPKTVEAYGRDVRAFLEFLAARGKTTSDALVRADVTDHVGALRAKGRKASTRARAFVAVREFLAFLASTHATAHDLSEGLEAPRKNLVLPRVLDEETTLKILKSADGVEPRDTPISPDAPKMGRGEDRYMSRPEAIYILGKLATSRRINVDGVTALQMGARSLMKRHFDRQRNWARRRERAAEDSKRTTASAEHGQEAQT